MGLRCTKHEQNGATGCSTDLPSEPSEAGTNRCGGGDTDAERRSTRSFSQPGFVWLLASSSKRVENQVPKEITHATFTGGLCPEHPHDTPFSRPSEWIWANARPETSYKPINTGSGWNGDLTLYKAFSLPTRF